MEVLGATSGFLLFCSDADWDVIKEAYDDRQGVGGTRRNQKGKCCYQRTDRKDCSEEEELLMAIELGLA